MDDFPHHRPRRGCGCGCSGCFSLVMGLGILVITAVIPVFAVSFSHGDSDQAAVAAFNRCPAVTDALGKPVARTEWTMAWGESQSGGGSGTGNWTISVHGPKGSGRGWYSARYVNSGPWEIQMATVQLDDGRKLTAVPCETREEKPEPRPSKPAPAPKKKKGKHR
jgi:hypothetical protein